MTTASDAARALIRRYYEAFNAGMPKGCSIALPRMSSTG